VKGASRLDPQKLDRALAVRGLDGDKLAQLSALDHSTVSRARQGKPVRPKTIRQLVHALEKVPALGGVEELLP
jgi:DNA-binding Xre family transcriptional regulator